METERYINKVEITEDGTFITQVKNKELSDEHIQRLKRQLFKDIEKTILNLKK